MICGLFGDDVDYLVLGDRNLDQKHTAPGKPSPIFDNLEHLENPFQLKDFSCDAFFPEQKPIDGASTDYEAAWKFIYSYNGSPATFNVYRRELERLLQWAWHVRGSNVRALKREDIESYVEFCQKPPKSWIGTKNVARFKRLEGWRGVNPDWHPFVVQVRKTAHMKGEIPKRRDFTLSQASVQAIFSVLSSFYNFLMQENITEANPVALIRQKSKYIRKNQQQAPVRRISTMQWDFVIETVEQMALEKPATYERSLFILNCLLGMYLRISELVADERSAPSMGDFRKDNDGHWWFHVIGKGNKSRRIAVCNEMLAALKRFRISQGLSPLPFPGETTPLVSKNLGTGPVTSTRQIRTIVQTCFDAAYDRMVTEGYKADAEELRVATVHWLRHTAISEDVKRRPREHVRDDAGHASMQTTDRYIESDARERHTSGRKKFLKNVS